MLLGINTGNNVYASVEVLPVEGLESEYKQVIRYREFAVTLYHLIHCDNEPAPDWAIATLEDLLDSLNAKIKEIGSQIYG